MILNLERVKQNLCDPVLKLVELNAMYSEFIQQFVYKKKETGTIKIYVKDLIHFRGHYRRYSTTFSMFKCVKDSFLLFIRIYLCFYQLCI